jgi:hypothetical protein
MGHKQTKRQRDKLVQELSKHIKPVVGKKKFDWVAWLALFLAIIGLPPTIASWSSKPSVSLEAPLDPRDVLSTPVVLSNDGLMAIHNVQVATFIIKAAYDNGMVEIENTGAGYVPPNETLDHASKQVVPFKSLVNQRNARIIYADVALVVSYTPDFFPFWKKTRAFRFLSVWQADGLLRLEEQPESEALNKYTSGANNLPKSKKP